MLINMRAKAAVDQEGAVKEITPMDEIISRRPDEELERQVRDVLEHAVDGHGGPEVYESF